MVDLPDPGTIELQDDPLSRRPTLTGTRTAELPCPDGGTRLDPPPFENVGRWTQACFGAAFAYPGLDDWPPHDCARPCIVPEDACEPPDLRSGNAAPMQPLVVTTATSPIPAGWQLLPAGTQLSDIRKDVNVVQAASALLSAHLDLVEWAVCLATTWSPRTDDPESWTTCATDAVEGGQAIYLIEYFIDQDDGSIASATGAATGRVLDEPGGVMEGTGTPGVVLPIGKWANVRDAYADRGANPTKAMCAVAVLAGTILHEIIHACSTAALLDLGDDVDHDDYPCFAIQNQAATNFGWALAQRYPCLQTAACCPQHRDEYFEHAGELGPNPYPYDHSQPC